MIESPLKTTNSANFPNLRHLLLRILISGGKWEKVPDINYLSATGKGQKGIMSTRTPGYNILGYAGKSQIVRLLLENGLSLTTSMNRWFGAGGSLLWFSG